MVFATTAIIVRPRSWEKEFDDLDKPEQNHEKQSGLNECPELTDKCICMGYDTSFTCQPMEILLEAHQYPICSFSTCSIPQPLTSTTMIEEQHFDVYPLGWENDPEVERFRLSKFDYFSNCAYSQYAILFRLTDADKPKVATVLQKGLERTLSRARHFCGDIEKDPKGGYSIVKRRKSAVCLFIYWYDAPGDTKKHPSFDDLAESNFSTVALSCLNVFTRISMRHRIIPDARPDYRARRVVSAFKAHFIRGGLMLDMFVHHYASDAVGWAGFAHQLAQNCYAIMDNTAFPTWDPA